MSNEKPRLGSGMFAKAVVSWQPQHALSIVETSSLRRYSGNGPQLVISHIGPGLQGTYGVEIKPLLVATTKRLPQRTIESTRPTPGTVCPGVTFQTPLGPSNTAVP